MIHSSVGEVFRDFVSLFFPKVCLACSDALVKGEQGICTRCMLDLPATDYHLIRENPLMNRLSYRFPLRYALACYRFTKSGKVQHLLHALKYKGKADIGVTLGLIYGEKLLSSGFGSSFDLILPIPLHPSRKRKRGYNQSAMFAQGLSEKLGIPFSDDVLSRRFKTETQTRKTKLSRWENMSDVFTIQSASALESRNVLLVDDVITTGSTLEACAVVLGRSQCSSLSIACIAEA
jgi:ComF family protein